MCAGIRRTLATFCGHLALVAMGASPFVSRDDSIPGEKLQQFSLQVAGYHMCASGLSPDEYISKKAKEEADGRGKGSERSELLQRWEEITLSLDHVYSLLLCICNVTGDELTSASIYFPNRSRICIRGSWGTSRRGQLSRRLRRRAQSLGSERSSSQQHGSSIG